MRALGDGDQDRLQHVRPVEEDLLVVEPQHGVSARHEPCIGGEISTTISGTAVVCEPVYLDDEQFTDEPIDGMSVQPHLLSHGDTGGTHSVDESRLQSGIGER